MNFNNMNEWHHTVVVPRTPNVIFATPATMLDVMRARGTLDDLPNTLHKGVLLTAMAAAKERPDWKFFITQTGSNMSTACNIVHGQELLGVLSVDGYYNRTKGTYDTRLALTSPSIRNAAVRKNHIASADPKRILRALLAECNPTPPETAALGRADRTASVANQLINDATTYSVDSNINPTVLYAFLQEQNLWDAFKLRAVASGAKSDFGAEVERRCALKVTGDTLAAAKKSGKMLVATGVAGGYYVFGMDMLRGLQGGPPVYVSDSDLNDDMQTKLGMLKLTNANTLIPNVGVRTNADGNTFALVGEAS
jgi:hypothetical protein